MRFRLPRRRIVRAAIYLACLLVVLLAMDLLLVQWRRQISTGYFTTRITSPLREDGRIDYLTALETFFSEGVTPQNNAGPLLLRAYGRAALPSNQPDDGITNRLGMPHLPKEGDYFIPYEDWFKQHSAPQQDDVTDAFDSKRWPPKFSTETAQWLNDNEKPLALVIEASKRSRYFIPFNGGTRTWTILEVLLPQVRFINDTRRPLLTRAITRLDAGDVAGFREDLLAVHRLARLIAQSPTLVERIAAIQQLEIPACLLGHGVALSGKLSGKDAVELANGLEALGDLPPIADAINVSERYMGLDVMQSMARLTPYRAGEMFNMVVDRGPRIPPIVMSLVPVGYEDSMRRINNFHDGTMAATELPLWSQRVAALKLCEELLAPAAKQCELFKRVYGDWPAAYLLPALAKAHEARRDGKNADAAYARYSLALVAFKADHGAYPAALNELALKYISTVPIDLFSDKPLLFSGGSNGFRLASVGLNMTDDAGKKGMSSDDLVVESP